MKKKLLLLSNSTNFGEDYLFYPREAIKTFLGDSISRILFIPYAGVTSTFDEYTAKVAQVFQNLGYLVDSVYLAENHQELFNQAEAIVVGGGNTFNLFYWLHKNNLIEIIREKVNNGTPYIGWSAGANAACPSLKTTNDMPIVEPASFNGLNLVPFQINPHYTDVVLPNHNGETREQRIREFITINQDIYVVGLREGCILSIEGSSLKLIGDKPLKLFKFNEPIVEYSSHDNLDFLVQ